MGKNILKQSIKVALPVIAKQLLKKSIGFHIGIAFSIKDTHQIQLLESPCQRLCISHI